MKKILCLLLAVVISISLSLFPSYAEESNKVSAIELLSELGIVKGYEDGLLHPEYNITRMEYAALIIRCLGYDGDYPSVDTVFTDVPKNSWGAAAVQFAYDLGIISGYGDGTFGPDDNILEVDAVKIIVSALGRGLEAESSGGYPTGYLSVAQKLRVLEDYKGGEEKATRGFVAKLIANALNVSIVEQNFTSNSFMENQGRTILSILGLSKYDGILTACCGVNIESGENVLSDEIVISGRKFKADKAFSADYVGENVSAYIYRYGESDEKAVAMFVSAKETKNLVVDAKDIKDQTNLLKFVYQDGNKEKEIDLPLGFYIAYNGTLLDKSVDITPDKLKPKNGYVKLLDTNRDDVYDTALVKDYKTFVVKTVTDDAIYDIYGNSIIFEINEENAYILTMKSGEITSFEDIKAGDVLDIASNVSKTVAEILICDSIAKDKVISTSTKDGILYYGLENGEKYSTTAEYNNALTKKYKEALEIEIGGKYNLGLNSFGEIAVVREYVPEDGEEDTYSHNNKEKYGFLCDAGVVANAIDDTLEVKILTTKNRLEIFKSADSKEIFFGRMEGGRYRIEKNIPNEIYARLQSSPGVIKNQLIKYVLDENENLRELYLVDSMKNSANLSMDDARSNHTFAYNTLGQKWYYDENTVVFVLPGEGNYDYNIMCTTPGGYMSDNKTYNSEIYDVDSNGYINCICIYPNMVYRTNGAVESFVVDVINDPVMLVTYIGEEVNEDGIVYKIVEGYEDGKKIRRLLSDGLSRVANIRPGMIIQYGTNKADLQYALYAEDDEVMLGFVEMFDCGEYDKKQFIRYDHKDRFLSNARCHYGYGTITSVDFPTITISVNNIKSTVHSGTMLLKYSSNSGIVEKIDESQIVEGQKVFFRKRLLNLRDLIVIE